MEVIFLNSLQGKVNLRFVRWYILGYPTWSFISDPLNNVEIIKMCPQFLWKNKVHLTFVDQEKDVSLFLRREESRCCYPV